ncbi:hypothetical protein [Bradyrhizobium arachidis]|uniref:hypothetical protein n=1 Tax=Bradyrhizobium arachidis TaxID=858423 RepID=UPI002162AB28|nr:hypothetical protein [Bradyrhizobium arachidis]
MVDETLEILRAAGRRGTEGIVLWLARRPLGDGSLIAEAFVPEHTAEVDVFRIPPTGMTALMVHLKARKLALAAQVHSHPAEAFHSRADDAWAIVCHEGALSIVVPQFAKGVTAANFLDRSASFCLSPDDRWLEVPAHDLPQYLMLT